MVTGQVCSNRFAWFRWCGALLFCFCTGVWADDIGADERLADIEQARGVDSDVDYESLTRFGPWDDRNYALTKDDLALLSPEEHLLPDPIPAFFRVEIRKARPKMRRHGEGQYSLSALNAFNLLHRGYEIDGVIYKGIRRRDDGSFVYRSDRETKAWKSWPKFLSGEVKISTPNGAAESAIAINPVDTVVGSERVIAGTNGPGPGQRMWRSSDGGATWIESQPLTGGGTCCDPTVAWSTDGTKAYASALVDCGVGGCGIRFYRSDDNGDVWGDNDPGTSAPPPVTVIANGGDKQFIHVDVHPSSPFRDRIYMCWHEDLAQKFGRSSDFGVTFTNTGTVDPDALGAGCDVSSDHLGHVYFFHPTFDTGADGTRKQIRVAKSTDGGVSFGPGVTVAVNQDGFNYPLPSMNTRRVAKIVQADADTTGGPFNGSMYVIWPDLTAPESTIFADNHSIVRVGFSRDGGATWTITSPHSLSDTDTVDRYQPSIKVDRLGRVHTIFYDTRRSPDRTAVDVFYAVSYDGAATWTPARRVTTQLSPKIQDNFEFGDYSHMDGVMDNIIATFTDNRDETGNAEESVDAYAVANFADTFTPGYIASVTPERQEICQGGLVAPVIVNLRSTGGFATALPLTMDPVVGLNNVQFSPSIVTPNAAGVTSQLSFDVSAAASGVLNFAVRSSNSTPTPTQPEARGSVNVVPPFSNGPVPLAPVNSARGVSTTPRFFWDPLPNARSYRLEVATDPVFANVVATVNSTTANATIPTPLLTDVRYYWRIRATNVCGNSSFTTPRTFLTRSEFCVSPNLPIPNESTAGVTSNIVIPSSVTGNITDANVAVRVTHTSINNLRITVRPSSGTPNVRLINLANCSGDNMDTTFDDESPNAFACSNNAVPAVSLPSIRSIDLLSALDSQPIAGTWQLLVADVFGIDVGTLDRWCIDPGLPSTNEILFADHFE